MYHTVYQIYHLLYAKQMEFGNQSPNVVSNYITNTLDTSSCIRYTVHAILTMFSEVILWKCMYMLEQNVRQNIDFAGLSFT